MSDSAGYTPDRIIESVKQYNAGYNNTDYAKRSPEKLGSGTFYTVLFKGNDNLWRENYVFERGKTIKVYDNIREVLKDSSNGIIPLARDPDFIKLVIVSLLTLIFATSVVGIVILNPDNKSLQVLTGLLGLTLGYFVGKGDKTS